MTRLKPLASFWTTLAAMAMGVVVIAASFDAPVPRTDPTRRSVLAEVSVTQTPIVVGSAKGVTALAFDPVKSRLAATLSNGSVVVWDARTVAGAETWTEVSRIQPTTEPLRRLSFGKSPVTPVSKGNGATLPPSRLFVAGDDGNVYAVDPDANVTHPLGIASAASTSMSCSINADKDGKNDKKKDDNGNKEGSPYRLHRKSVTALAVSPDGERVASGDESGVVVLASSRQGGCARRIREGKKVDVVGLAFDNENGLTVLEKGIRGLTLNLSTLAERRAFEVGKPRTVATSSAVYDRRGHVIVVPAEERVHDGVRRPGTGGRTPSPDELSRASRIVAYRTNSWELSTPVPTHSTEVRMLALTPGACFAVGTSNERVTLGSSDIKRTEVLHLLADHCAPGGRGAYHLSRAAGRPVQGAGNRCLR